MYKNEFIWIVILIVVGARYMGLRKKYSLWRKIEKAFSLLKTLRIVEKIYVQLIDFVFN